MKTSEKIAKLTGLTKEQVQMLFNEGLIEPKNAIRYLLCTEFKERKTLNPNRPNSKIYFELSEDYKVSESTAYKWVNDYKQI